MTTIEELSGRVIYIKNRVWTIYAKVRDGILCYEGVKPYEGFVFDSDNPGGRITSYFHLEEVTHHFIEREEIEWFMKKMTSADKKPLTKEHAVDFYVHLTAHSKSFVSKNIEEGFIDSFEFTPGSIRFSLWKKDGALSLSHNIHGTTHIAHFDFLTYKPHHILNEKSDDERKEEIIESYKDMIDDEN